MSTKTKKRPAKPLPAGSRKSRPSKAPLPSAVEPRERWTVRVKSHLVGRVNRAALYGLPRVTVSEILETAIEAELAKRERTLPVGVPLVGRGEIPRGRIPSIREPRS